MPSPLQHCDAILLTACCCALFLQVHDQGEIAVQAALDCQQRRDRHPRPSRCRHALLQDLDRIGQIRSGEGRDRLDDQAVPRREGVPDARTSASSVSNERQGTSRSPSSSRSPTSPSPASRRDRAAPPAAAAAPRRPPLPAAPSPSPPHPAARRSAAPQHRRRCATSRSSKVRLPGAAVGVYTRRTATTTSNVVKEAKTLPPASTRGVARLNLRRAEQGNERLTETATRLHPAAAVHSGGHVEPGSAEKPPGTTPSRRLANLSAKVVWSFRAADERRPAPRARRHATSP